MSSEGSLLADKDTEATSIKKNQDYAELKNRSMFGRIYDDPVFLSGDMNGPQYSKRHAAPRNTDRSIRSDLEKYGFPPKIIEMAEMLHRDSNTGTRRGRRRKQTVFYYALGAYNRLGIPGDPQEIAKKCELRPSEVSKSMSRCSNQKNIGVPQIVVHSPIDFLNHCYNKLVEHTDLQVTFNDNTLDNITDMATEVLAADPELKDQKPQMVAAAILLYYLSTHGMKVDRKNYAKLFSSSDMTINKLSKAVEIAYNKT